MNDFGIFVLIFGIILLFIPILAKVYGLELEIKEGDCESAVKNVERNHAVLKVLNWASVSLILIGIVLIIIF